MIHVGMSILSFVFSWEKKRNNKRKDEVLTHWILKLDMSLVYLEVFDHDLMAVLV